jgi:hypothetical protein
MDIDTEIANAAANTEYSIEQLTKGQLRAEAAGDKALATSYLQRKVEAQRKALHVLNERVVNQRFVLRNLERLGRGLSTEELAAARELEGTAELVGAS